MSTKDILLELRMKNGLSQDSLAEKVFVTRQAVSRWENGETVPNTETLKMLSKLFGVSINTLLGSPHKLICQCCGMPLEDDIIGKNKDGSLNEDYCRWCYADGTYTYSNGVVDHHGNYKTEGSAIHILSMEGTKEWSQFLYYFENIKTFQIVSKQLRLYVSSTSYLLFEPMP